MAPLMAKVGDAFHKLNGKLSSKRRISDEGEGDNEGSQQPKQPRILSAQPSASGITSVAGKKLPYKVSEPGAASSSYISSPASPFSSPSSATNEDPWDQESSYAGSSSNPIDLTDSPDDLGEGSRASTGMSSAAKTSPLFGESSPGKAPAAFLGRWASKNSREHRQINADEALARALQEAEDEHGGPLQPDMSAAETLSGSVPLQAYGRRLRAAACPRCRVRIAVDGDTVVSRTKTQLVKGLLHPYLACPSCRTWCCIWCRSQSVNQPTLLNNRGSGKNGGKAFKVTWCCDESRSFLVWSLLCGQECHKPDGQYPGFGERFRARLTPKADPDPKPAPTTKLSKASKHNHSILSKGTGYGGSEIFTPSFSLKLPHPKSTPKPDDELLGCYLACLSILLPCRSRFQQFDQIRHPLIAAALRRSPLLEKVAEILRTHNSIEDISAQFNLYAAIVEFLETIGGHNDTLPLVFQDQIAHQPAEQLVHATYATTNTRRPGDFLHTTPISVSIQRLAGPCRAFVKTASAHADALLADGEQSLVALIQRICDIADLLEQNRYLLGNSHRQEPVPSPTPPPTVQPPTVNVMTRARATQDAALAAQAKARQTKAEIEVWHRDHCVEELDDEKILEDFWFAGKARNMGRNSVAKGRMKKLVTQISSLHTDLPTGIYVRHGSSRLDVIKVLMVGPADTPYENGLFEFDMFCTDTFPLIPPEMQFRTTGNGAAAFNPNLYNNGKVCLSLLGTWAGQGWEPERSTILQVLVSIQGMIFTNQPWYNEPGRERHQDKTRSDNYNRQIQGLTVQHAMIPWLLHRLGQPEGSEVPAGKGLGKAPAPTPVATEAPAPFAPPLALSLMGLPPVSKANTMSPTAPFPTTSATKSDIQNVANVNKAAEGADSKKAPPVSSNSSAPTPENLISIESYDDEPDWLGLGGPLPQAPFHGAEIVTSTTMPPFSLHWGAASAFDTVPFFKIAEATAPPPPEPESTRNLVNNTAVDRNDDYAWGMVIRKHFSSGLIMDVVKKWAQQGAVNCQVKELEEALDRHGFPS
ncbi:hypothetical protein B0T22DRAFT_214295 [Podospora appendiculata]|uniref:UBC core domain-containing protein n=1 Tax=Podospora appendiculata TaxID=314037 RepID=A0AAE0X566_9PEZI|nr:hypothetical protein B0T22DRAFT_214295 [Podospora appendiculata]